MTENSPTPDGSRADRFGELPEPTPQTEAVVLEPADPVPLGPDGSDADGD